MYLEIVTPEASLVSGEVKALQYQVLTESSKC